LFHDTVAINLLITSRSKVTQERNRLKVNTSENITLAPPAKTMSKVEFLD